MAETVMYIKTEINTEELARQIVTGLDRAGIEELIMSIDAQITDWDFTMDIYKRFESLKEEFEEEGRKMLEDET